MIKMRCQKRKSKNILEIVQNGFRSAQMMLFVIKQLEENYDEHAFTTARRLQPFTRILVYLACFLLFGYLAES